MTDAAIPSPLKELLATFAELDDRDLRADLLIEIAERFVTVPESIAARPYPQEHQVPSCESEVYVWAAPTPDGVKLSFAVENPQGISARAMAVILTESFAHGTLSEILAIDSSIVQLLFGKGITMGKGQGLTSMLITAQTLARGLS